MAISNATSALSNYVSQASAVAAKSPAVKVDRENDGDGDDKKAAVPQSANKASAPSVNLNGQSVGTIVNTKA